MPTVEDKAPVQGAQSETPEPEQVGEPKPKTQSLTPKQRQAGLHRLRDPSASRAEIMRRAGYSPVTAAHKTVDVDALARRVTIAEGVTPARAGKLGLRVLAEMAENQGSRFPASAQGAAAVKLVDYSTAQGGDTGESPADLPTYLRSLLRAYLHGMKTAQRHNGNALEHLDAVARRLTGRPAVDWLGRRMVVLDMQQCVNIDTLGSDKARLPASTSGGSVPLPISGPLEPDQIDTESEPQS